MCFVKMQIKPTVNLLQPEDVRYRYSTIRNVAHTTYTLYSGPCEWGTCR